MSNEMLEGELNYPVGTRYVDIALVDSGIMIPRVLRKKLPGFEQFRWEMMNGGLIFSG